MPKNVILPALGMAQDTGTILRWLKAEGDSVTQGEPLAEIETDKATVEIEALASGILSSVSASVGDEVPVGQVIAVILTPDEVSSERTPTRDVPTSPSSSEDVGVSLVGTPSANAAPQSAAQNDTMAVQPRLLPASPKARRLAAEHGQDISSIRGSGPDGAVLAVDVLTTTRPSHT